MKMFDRDDLLMALPYGDSFLFLNEANVYEEDSSGSGYYIVPSPEKSQIVKDHFPGLPILPGHIQMEAVAQLAALIYLVKYGSPDRPVLPVLTVSYADLATFAQPGDQIFFYASIRVKNNKVEVDGKIELDGNYSHVAMEGVAIPMKVLGRMAARKKGEVTPPIIR